MFPQVVAIIQRRTPEGETVAVLGALGDMTRVPLIARQACFMTFVVARSGT
jgi:hypothetical protein